MRRERVEQRLREFFTEDARGVEVVYLLESPEQMRVDSEVALAVSYAEPLDLSFAALPLRLEDELEKLLAQPVRVMVLEDRRGIARRRARVLFDARAAEHAQLEL